MKLVFRDRADGVGPIARGQYSNITQSIDGSMTIADTSAAAANARREAAEVGEWPAPKLRPAVMSAAVIAPSKRLSFGARRMTIELADPTDSSAVAPSYLEYVRSVGRRVAR